MLQTVPTKTTFNRVTTCKHCPSYHETKFFHDQQVDSVNNKLSVFIMKHNLPKILYDMLKINTKLVLQSLRILKYLLKLCIQHKVSLSYISNSRNNLRV